MIIHVNALPHELTAAQNADAADFMAKLFMIFRTASHRLIIEPDFIDWARDNFQYGADELLILDRLERSYTTAAGLIGAGLPYIEVSSWGDEGDVALHGFKVGVKRFNKLRIYLETRVVVENASNDSEILRILIKATLEDLSVGVPAMEFVNGGGSTLADEFARQLKDGHIAVTIFDSDKRYPSDQESVKLTPCRHALASSKTKLGFYLQLPCHEIENVIPYALARDISDNGAHACSSLEKIESMERQNGIPLKDRFKLFFDYKDGVIGINDGTPRKVKSSEFAIAKMKLAGKDISTSKFDGFGPAMLDAIANSGIFLGRLRRELRSCPYWQDVFSPEFAKIAPYLIGGDASQTI